MAAPARVASAVVETVEDVTARVAASEDVSEVDSVDDDDLDVVDETLVEEALVDEDFDDDDDDLAVEVDLRELVDVVFLVDLLLDVVLETVFMVRCLSDGFVVAASSTFICFAPQK